MRSAESGRLLVVDASVLFEVVAGTAEADRLSQRLRADPDLAAPYLIDAEVLSVIEGRHRSGDLDRTAATQAVEHLVAWPGQRWPHRPFVPRAWELRDNIRAYDALYIALAEALDATVLTLDERLTRAPGLRCAIEIP
jgi:predicted nucleic acid-binding protein